MNYFNKFFPFAFANTSDISNLTSSDAFTGELGISIAMDAGSPNISPVTDHYYAFQTFVSSTIIHSVVKIILAIDVAF